MEDRPAWCGFHVVDLDSGARDDWFRIDRTVAEIYATLIAGRRWPMAVGLNSPDAATLLTFTDPPSNRTSG